MQGGGTFTEGQEITVQAVPNTGFTFVNWTEDGGVVSSSASYTFTVTANRNLIANFDQATALPGVLMLLLDDN